MVYSANELKRIIYVDHALRIIQSNFLEMQLCGGASAYRPVVFSSEGKFKDTIVFAALRNVSTEFTIFSGGKFEKIVKSMK